MDHSQLMQGAYDIHLHAAPDVIPRSMDLPQLAQAANAAGMAGLLVKDHCTSTAGRVAVANQMFAGKCRFFSSIALNPPVGGMNPAAVESALRAGADVVFFPTYGAAHHISVWGAGKPPTAFPLPPGEFKGIRIVDAHNRLKPEALEILDLIAEFDAVLATGHISPAESLALLRAANRRGLERMLLTHASESVSAVSIAAQKEAVELGVLVEHSFFAVTPSCPNPTTLADIHAQIRAIGVERIILSSDFGQPANGHPIEGFRNHLLKLQELGCSSEELRQMICRNPERLLKN